MTSSATRRAADFVSDLQSSHLSADEIDAKLARTFGTHKDGEDVFEWLWQRYVEMPLSSSTASDEALRARAAQHDLVVDIYNRIKRCKRGE